MLQTKTRTGNAMKCIRSRGSQDSCFTRGNYHRSDMAPDSGVLNGLRVPDGSDSLENRRHSPLGTATEWAFDKARLVALYCGIIKGPDELKWDG